MADDTLLWAYGVVPASARPVAVAGLDGGPVDRIPDGDLAVLASTVPAGVYRGPQLRERLEDLAALEEMARTHDAVLEAALGAGDVVPFPICTLYETPGAIQHMLAAERERFTATLRRLHGKEEWGVKGFAQAAGKPGGAEPPTSGADYLARRRAQRQSAEASAEALEAAVADAHGRLAAGASGAALLRLQDRRLSGRDAEMLLNGAYLVAREDAEEFRSLVEALAREHEQAGLALELTGPWPPYHFATEAI